MLRRLVMSLVIARVRSFVVPLSDSMCDIQYDGLLGSQDPILYITLCIKLATTHRLSYLMANSLAVYDQALANLKPGVML